MKKFNCSVHYKEIHFKNLVYSTYINDYIPKKIWILFGFLKNMIKYIVYSSTDV